MISLFLANALGWITLHWRTVAIVAAFTVLIVSVGLWAYCGDSRIEKRIEERNPVINEQQAGANHAINAAVNANKDAADKVATANAIRTNKQTNVNMDEAKQNMCRAYPELEVCR